MARIQPCNKGCGKQIYVAQTDSGWRPFDADTDQLHDCPNYKKQAAPATTTATTTSEPVLKQNVGSQNSILLQLVQQVKQEVETQNTILEQILETVLGKSTSNNKSVIVQGVGINKIQETCDAVYEELRLVRAEQKEIKDHFKISSFQPATQLSKAATAAQLDDIEELANTDDQTNLDSHSINHARQDD